MRAIPTSNNSGALLGASSIAFFLGALCSASILAFEAKPAISMFDGRLQWETLLTGLLALASAGWTVLAIRRQTANTAEIEADKRVRRERAVRATLPLALTEFCTDALNCMEKFGAVLENCPDEGIDKNLAKQALADWGLPEVPDEAIAVIKECIEFAEDGPASAMTDLLRHFQIHYVIMALVLSQLRSSDIGKLVIRSNIEQGIINAAEVHARAGRLFDFSRGIELPSYQPDQGQISAALTLAGLFDVERLTSRAGAWEPKDYARPPI